jgi:branched-chain amino acid transport system substrate-binding protein
MRYFAVLLFVTLMIPASVFAASSETIKIGAMFNLTGGMAAIDAPALKGVKLAAKLINSKGGLLGGRLEIVVADTKTDLKVTAQAAKKLVSIPVTAGIGYGDTDYVLAAAPFFQNKGIPFVTSGATDPGLPKKIGSELFMIAYGDNTQAAAMAAYAFKGLKARNIVVLTDKDTHFTRILSKYFKESFTKLGGKIIADYEFGKDHKEINDIVGRIRKLSPSPDAIYVAGNPLDVGPTVIPLRKAGVDAPILSGDGFDSDLKKTLGSEKIKENIYFTTHDFKGDKRPEVVNFIAAYKKEYGNKPVDAFAALGYDALNLVASALKRAGTTDTSKLTKAIAETKGFDGVTGIITYARPSAPTAKPVSVIHFNDGAYRLAHIQPPQQPK